MTFIEAALSLLKKSRKSLTAEQLAERAEKEELLSKPGANPQRSMKAALSRELKKGKDSRVVRVDDDRYQLAKGAEQAAAPKGKATKATRKKTQTKKRKTAAKTTRTKKAAAAEPAAEEADKAAAKKVAKKAKKTAAKKKTTTTKAAAKKKTTTKAAAKKKTTTKAAAKKKTTTKAAAKKKPVAKKEAEAGVTPIAEEARAELGELLAPKEPPVRAEPPPTPAEEEVEEIYGDELTGTEPGAAFAEYRDELTADEDRQMMPEIVATRRERNKRERRRRRRDRQKGGEARAKRGAEAAPAAPAAEVAAPAEEAPSIDVPWYRPGNAIGSAAVEVLRTSKGKQSVRAKQITQMLCKRQLVSGDPETMWPHVKVALLSDEQDFAARGLRPRIVYKGKDLFALGEVADRSARAALEEEAEVIRATEQLAVATHQAVKERLSGLERAALERVAHVYLVRQGWTNLEWIKRVQRSSYAVGDAPGVGTMLIGVRAGGEPVDRRGVGELRVGIQAKGLPCGLLIAPQELSDVARDELRRPGPSISLLIGDAFVASLIHSGIGVRRGPQLSAARLDEVFFREVERD